MKKASWQIRAPHCALPAGLKARCAAAWRRFVACVEALPPDQAAPLWQAAQVQTMKALEIGYAGA
jgi:hypothetical protein